jgi:hypothetical protein
VGRSGAARFGECTGVHIRTSVRPDTCRVQIAVLETTLAGLASQFQTATQKLGRQPADMRTCLYFIESGARNAFQISIEQNVQNMYYVFQVLCIM